MQSLLTRYEIDMAHQQARERWQPDSPALLECDRRAVNLQPELRRQAVIRIRGVIPSLRSHLLHASLPRNHRQPKKV